MSCYKCKKSNCYGNCCGNVSPATPLQPYCPPQYSCPEDHCQMIINQQYASALKIDNSWNVPDCGGSATLHVTGLTAVSIGSFLWASPYGYFEIVGFNAETGNITIENICADGNAPVGSAIPACSYFIISDGPIEAGGSGQPSLFPYVAVDFTAPENGNCLLITVTTVNGLVVGKNVQISSGTYRVNAIPDGTHIEICNDGFGVVPGTAVIAKNAANQFQYPVILVDANPCTNPEVDDGCLIVCKDNIMSPLGGMLLAGSVPVVQADGECGVAFQLLEVPTRTCATITCCLTLVPGTLVYVIAVSDSSQFTIGDVLQIGTRTDRYTVDVIIDGTHIQVTVDTDPGSVTEIAPGTSICIIDCCEALTTYVDSDAYKCSDFQNEVLFDIDQVFSAAAIQTLNAGNPSYYTPSQILVVNNPSTCRNMRVFVQQEVYLFGNAQDGNTNLLNIDLRAGYSIVANPPPDVMGGGFHLFPRDDADHQYTFTRTFTSAAGPVAPGGVVNIVHRAGAVWTGGGASAFAIDPAALWSRIAVFGVAV